MFISNTEVCSKHTTGPVSYPFCVLVVVDATYETHYKTSTKWVLNRMNRIFRRSEEKKIEKKFQIIPTVLSFAVLILQI